MRKYLVAGNWKMNCTLDEAVKLSEQLVEAIGAYTEVETLICPPAIDIPSVSFCIRQSNIKLGAQNMNANASGAYTGEISYPMLKPFCQYVILGHSERRQIFGEKDAMIAEKAKAAVANGIIPIVCIGETLEENEAGKTAEILKFQLDESLKELTADDEIVIAYEPIWAIGTGKAATAETAQNVLAFIREHMKVRFGQVYADRLRILYGGSVKPSNAYDIMSQPDVDGVLVGGACLRADDFKAIADAAIQAI